MIIGTLLEVLGLNEDAQTALRNRRITNRKLTGGDFIYDGSQKDYEDKVRRRSTRTQYNRFQRDMKKTGWSDGAVEAYDRGSKLIGVNKQYGQMLGTINPDGTINRNHPAYKHENQHKNQFEIARQMAGRGRNANKRYDNLSNKMMDSYHLNDLTSKDPDKAQKAYEEYLKNPLEYNANVAGGTGQNTKNTEAVRAVKTAIGTSNNPLRITTKQGELANANILPRPMKQAQINDVNQRYAAGIGPVSPFIKKSVDPSTVPVEIQNQFNAQQKQNQPVQQKPVQPQLTPQQVTQINRFNRMRNKSLAGKPVQQVNQFTKPNQNTIQNLNKIKLAGNKLMCQGGVADRNTGIVYAKKNGKLVSNMMTASQQK